MADSRVGVARLQLPEHLPPDEHAQLERAGVGRARPSDQEWIFRISGAHDAVRNAGSAPLDARDDCAPETAHCYAAAYSTKRSKIQ
jgi:hypothetical protein